MYRQRRDGLVRETLERETVIFDTRSNVAHALDTPATAVWQACDGHTDAATIAEQLGLSETAVEATIARLVALDLLEEDRTVSRRAALRKMAAGGAAAASLPAITSLLIPPAAHAQSGITSEGGLGGNGGDGGVGGESGLGGEGGDGGDGGVGGEASG
jgi:uncharacterized membrane protein YgcG